MGRWTVGLAGAIAVLSCGCEAPTATVNLHAGPMTAVVRSSAFGLPEELRDGTLVRSTPCDPMGRCPTSDTVSVTCDGDLCDPAPTTVDFPIGAVIDLDELSSHLSDLAALDSVQATGIELVVRLNTLTVDLGEPSLFWAPEGATGTDSPGAARLGVASAIPAGATPAEEVELDPTGNAALSAYLTGTSRRVRLFARTRVDLAPGGPFPAGEATIDVQMSLLARGRVLE